MNGITITAEQLAERDQWEQKLLRGECSLEDALLMILHTGAPASAYLLARVEQAFASYRDGQCKTTPTSHDLAVAFGCVETRGAVRNERHETTRQNVKFHVQSFIDQGYPILNPNNYSQESAFTKTAKLLGNVSAATAFDIHYDRDIKKRKRAR